MRCSSFQKPAGLADGLGLESALSDKGIRPDFLVPPHPGVRDLGLIFTIFLGWIFVKRRRKKSAAAEKLRNFYMQG